MKLLPSLSVLAVAAAVLFGGSGCARTSPPSPKVVAYVSFATLGKTEAAAISAAATLRAEGKLEQETWQRIAALHDEFIVAYDEALVLAQLDYSQPAPETVRQLVKTILTLVDHYAIRNQK